MSDLPSPACARHYLEDLTVGQTFTSARHRLDHDQITTFARAFDPQPFHLDEEAAAQTVFQGLAASGWHTAAITIRLLVTGGLPIAGGIIGASVELTWPRPTRPGDELHVITDLLEITPSCSKPDRGVVSIRSRTMNQRNEDVQIMTARIIVPKRSRAFPDASA